MSEEKNEYSVIDRAQVLRYVLRFWWIIIASTLLCGFVGNLYVKQCVTPMYSSSSMIYVNNIAVKSDGLADYTSPTELSGAKELAKSYSVFLGSRTILEKVAEQAGDGYTWGMLSGMISSSIYEDTQIMKITVTCADPVEAARIVNIASLVLKEEVNQRIRTSPIEIFDLGVPNYSPLATSTYIYTLAGGVAGLLLSVATIILIACLDNKIRDEDYIMANYDFPILAKIPDLYDGSADKYAYSSKKSRSSGNERQKKQ